MVLSRNRVQQTPRRCSPHLPPLLTASAGDGRTCASPSVPPSTADRSARSKVTIHPRPPKQRLSVLGGQGLVPGAGSSAGSTRRRPRGTARWRRRQGRAPPPRPGRHAHRGLASGQERERAWAPGRATEGRSEAPRENESTGAWGRGRSVGPGHRHSLYTRQPPQIKPCARPTPVRSCPLPAYL